MIVIVDPQIWGFEGMIQRLEVTAIGTVHMYVAYEILLKSTVPLLPGHFWHRAVTHDGRFVRGWNGAFILQNCSLAC